ncbi:MAG: hypothetical protein VB106_04185 [Clostridiaceae bacterium]|nr:hypothetical protein [Clostridiaceae bacterium]
MRNINESKDLIAVITAAVIAMSGGKKNFVIRSIKRTTPYSALNWAFSGRLFRY